MCSTTSPPSSSGSSPGREQTLTPRARRSPARPECGYLVLVSHRLPTARFSYGVTPHSPVWLTLRWANENVHHGLGSAAPGASCARITSAPSVLAKTGDHATERSRSESSAAGDEIRGLSTRMSVRASRPVGSIVLTELNRSIPPCHADCPNLVARNAGTIPPVYSSVRRMSYWSASPLANHERSSYQRSLGSFLQTPRSAQRANSSVPEVKAATASAGTTATRSPKAGTRIRSSRSHNPPKPPSTSGGKIGYQYRTFVTLITQRPEGSVTRPVMVMTAQKPNNQIPSKTRPG